MKNGWGTGKRWVLHVRDMRRTFGLTQGQNSRVSLLRRQRLTMRVCDGDGMSLLGTTRADGNKEMVGSNKSSLLSGFYQGQEVEQFSMLGAMLVDARSLHSCHRTCDLYRCSPGTMLEGMRNHDGATTMLPEDRNLRLWP